MDVKNRRKTIPQAIALSAIIITIICIVVAAAVQWMDVNEVQQEGLILTTVLTPLFGTFASPLMALITMALCMGTYLLVTGGVARLIASESKRVNLLSILSYRSSTNVPIGAIGLLTIVHVFVFLFLYAGLTNMEQLVALANAFFISNAICGMLAAYKLLPGRLTKGLSLGLTICFLVILSFSSLWILFSIIVLTVFYLIRHVKHKDSMASNMLIADRKETIIK
jgi:amino acid efflux transporter